MSPKNNLLISYSLAHRFAWYRVAKVATRSINSILGDNISDYIYLDGGKKPDDLAALLRTGCFRFAFVRNPWDRLVSAWSNKIKRKHNRQHGYLKQLHTPFGSPLVRNLPEQSVESGLDFAVFLKLLPNSHLFHRNRHFLPQAEILADTDLDFTGRFDSFSRDFRYVLDSIGLSHLKDVIPHENKTTYDLHYSEMYFDLGCRKLVADLYSKDIDCWGFEFMDKPFLG